MAGGSSVKLDAREVMRALNATLENLERPRELMDGIGAAIVSQIDDCFEREMGPDGKPWAKSKRAIVEHGQTLADTGTLKKNIHFVAHDNEVEIGSNEPYAGFLQAGTKPHQRKKRRAGSLFWSGAEPSSAGIFSHPGMEARPFIPRDENELDWPEINNTITVFLGRSLK